MSSSETERIVLAEARNLGPLLHAGAATALAGSHVRAAGLGHAKYPHLVPMLMRSELREYLESNPVPNGWEISGDSRKMGQLLLRHSGLNLEMRFLKERRRTYPGGVPVAGASATRRKQWINEPLDFEMPGIPTTAQVDPVRLLLLWDFNDAEALDQFSLRIVHTLAAGTYGQAVPCDLIVDVEDGGTIFGHLSFPGAHDSVDFFEVDIDEREDESGS